MDRKIIYPGAIPLENDLLETNRFSMVGLAKLAEAIMGTSTFLHGLACRPTSPASMAVTVGAGEIYSLQNVDDTAYSSLPADTTHSILKQGLLVDAITLPLQAPSTNGLSQNYLIQIAYEESDTESTVLPYYNASNPTQAWHGPNNSGTAQGTVRSGKCIVKAKAGIAATTGTQTTPGPDSGYIGAFVVTVTAGQTELTSANIIMVPSAPFLPAGGLVAGIQSSQMTYARDYGTVNAYAADFTPPVTSVTDGMRLTFLASGANTGASTFSPNGLPAAPVYSNTSTALTGGEILASAQIEVIWNSTLSAWVLANTNLSALSKGFVRTVNDHEPGADGNVQLGTAADADIQTSRDDITAGRVLVNGSALALRTILVKAGTALSDFNDLPENSVGFGYSDATSSPGFTGSVLDYSGSRGGYRVHLAAQYNGDGNRIAFRTRNGDAAGAWNSWGEIFHTRNPPTAAQSGALPNPGTLLTSIYGIAGSGIYAALGKGADKPTEGMPDDSGNTRYSVLATEVYEGQYWVTLISKNEFYVGQVVISGKTANWCRYYNTGFKQTAVDAGALPITGGKLTGNLEINDNAPIIQFSEADTGKKYFIVVDGSGLRIDEDSTAGNSILSYAGASKQMKTVGQFVPTDYTNFDNRYQAKGSYTPEGEAYTKAQSDARYPTGHRTGARTKITGLTSVGDWSSKIPQGAVNIASLTEGNDRITDAYYAYPQYLINGNWVNFA